MSTVAERLASNSVRQSDGCLFYTRLRSHGYGVLLVGGRRGRYVMAHRAAFEQANGPIPAGLQVLHRCDQPACIEPTHLFLGTHADNMADKVAKGRQSRQGAPAGEASPQAKLTEDAVRTIRTTSDTVSELAVRYGVSRSTICDVRARKSWKQVA